MDNSDYKIQSSLPIAKSINGTSSDLLTPETLNSLNKLGIVLRRIHNRLIIEENKNIFFD